MNSPDFLQYLMSLFFAHPYLFLYPLTIIEGPIVTLAAGFWASIGHINIIIAFVIIIAGDLTGDMFCYAIGYGGDRWRFSRWVIHKLHFGKEKEKVRALFDTQGGKIMITGKLTHTLSMFAMIGAGYYRFNFLSFLGYNLAGAMIKSAALITLGYVAGSAYAQYTRTFERWALAITLIAIAVSVIVIFFYKYVKRRRAAQELLDISTTTIFDKK